jgi:hypothetical protein
VAITLLQMAEKVLEEEKRAMTAWEIWQAAEKKGYDQLVESIEKTPAASLSGLIYADTRDNPSSIFIRLRDRPNHFMVKSQIYNIRPGKKVRILEHVIYDVDDIMVVDVVATKGSIGIILSYEEYSVYIDDVLKRGWIVHSDHLAWVKSEMNARTRYPIRFEEVVPLPEDKYVHFETIRYTVNLSCQAGAIKILPTDSFVVI